VRRTILCLLLIAWNVTFAYALIGEPEPQIEKALGKPIKVSSGEQKTYAFGPYDVSVDYINGVSENEVFIKHDHSPISQKELVRLIHLNSGGVLWGRQKTNAQIVSWESADGRKTRVAAYVIASRKLVISSDKYFAAHDMETKSKPAPSGFTKTQLFAAARSKTAVTQMLLEPDKALFCPMNEIRFEQRDGKLLLFGWVETAVKDRPRHLKWGTLFDVKTSYVEMATFDSPAGSAEAQIDVRLHREAAR
jgi:hypothetical protein